MALLSARLNKGKVNAERLNWIGADVTAPTIPLNLAAAATGPRSIVLTWQASTDFYGVAYYLIERCSGAGCTTFALVHYVPGSVLTWTDHVEPLTTYRYRIRARDASNNFSGYSNIATATTPDRAPLTTVSIKVGGVWTDASPYVRVADATVTQALNEVVDTASITFNWWHPFGDLRGLEIRITDPATGVNHFAGYITAQRVIYEGRAKNVAYVCDCLDYTWVLNSRKVTARYTGQTVSAIATALVGTFAAGLGFTVNAGLLATNPIIDEITFTNEELGQALSRLCERGGLYWFSDYSRTVFVFSSAAIASAGTIDDTHPHQAAKLTNAEEFAAIVSRVIARGGGAGAASDAAIGQTTLPIQDPAWYSASGGIVECGPQRLTYTGIVGAAETGSTIGSISGPAPGFGQGTFTVYAAQTAGTHLPPGVYWVGIANMTGEGETLPYTFQFTIPAGYNEIWIERATLPVDPKVKWFTVFSTNAPGLAASAMGNISQAGPGSGPTADGFAWAGSGQIPITNGARYRVPPTINAAGLSSTKIPAGSTTLQVDELSTFPAAGWAEAPGGQLITYTGKSAASGPGTLTGIPASGVGAITAAINSGTIRSIPHLIGIPASGAGSIVYPIKTGDEVYIVVIRDDAAAVTWYAAITGGDGIREEFLTDGRLALAELTARADATLAMRAHSLVTITFESRDPAVVVGRTVTFNTTLPPIVGTFLIQRVTISQFQARGSIGHPDPLRVVEASSRRYTFDDLVQQIKLLGRIN